MSLALFLVKTQLLCAGRRYKWTHAHTRAQPPQNQLRLAQDQYSSPSPAPFKEPNSEIHLSAHASTIPPVSLSHSCSWEVYFGLCWAVLCLALKNTPLMQTKHMLLK